MENEVHFFEKENDHAKDSEVFDLGIVLDQLEEFIVNREMRLDMLMDKLLSLKEPEPKPRGEQHRADTALMDLDTVRTVMSDSIVSLANIIDKAMFDKQSALRKYIDIHLGEDKEGT